MGESLRAHNFNVKTLWSYFSFLTFRLICITKFSVKLNEIFSFNFKHFSSKLRYKQWHIPQYSTCYEWIIEQRRNGSNVIWICRLQVIEVTDNTTFI